jgi:hypothetical protein
MSMRYPLDSILAGAPIDAAIPHKRATGSAPIKERLKCL